MTDPKSANPSAEDFARSLESLKTESEDVKARIEQEKRKHDLPLDSNLGNPDWEEKAADGHLDLPEGDDD